MTVAIRTGFLCFAALLAASAQQNARPPVDWSFTPDPKLPNVLLIGDSISVGYTLEVRSLLKGKANVYRPMRPGGKAAANCFSTKVGLTELPNWLGDTKWDVIHFNWGLHDLCWRNPELKTADNRDKINGKIDVPLPEYKENLDKLAVMLKKTGARLIWASTTNVPEGEAGRYAADGPRYNEAAREVMQRHGIAIDDLYLVTSAMPEELSLGPGNVHYKPEGYKKLAQQVAASVEQALQKNK